MYRQRQETEGERHGLVAKGAGEIQQIDLFTFGECIILYCGLANRSMHRITCQPQRAFHALNVSVYQLAVDGLLEWRQVFVTA